MFDRKQRSSEAGGCIGCVFPCGVLVSAGLVGVVSVGIYIAHLLW